MSPIWPEPRSLPVTQRVPHAEAVTTTIAPSAFKHGISEENILHAYRNPIRLHRQVNRVLLVGGDWSGNLLEIGVDQSEEHDVIIHAMPTRDRLLR